MAKAKNTTQITVFDLVEKYLTKIGVSPYVLKTTLIPSMYEDVTYCHPQSTNNVVPSNKKGSTVNTSHIDVSTSIFGMFFTNTQISNFLANNSLNYLSDQEFIIFEANIDNMLSRRNKSKSKLLSPYKAKGIYSANTSNTVSAIGKKWLHYRSKAVHVHLGKSYHGDSPSFVDFRAGIMINDILVFLKEKHSHKILAISIPYEFAKRYSVIKVKSASKTAIQKQNVITNTAHSNYLAATRSKNTAAVISPPAPQPAPSPKKATGGKPKYVANPSIGKGALQSARYVCENCGSGTFTARSTGNDYMEPHHLIPISCQGNYANTIDRTENLICLCPNCHSQIHYGLNADREIMLKKFLTAKKNLLKINGGIDIDEKTLLAYYNI